MDKPKGESTPCEKTKSRKPFRISAVLLKAQYKWTLSMPEYVWFDLRKFFCAKIAFKQNQNQKIKTEKQKWISELSLLNVV